MLLLRDFTYRNFKSSPILPNPNRSSSRRLLHFFEAPFLQFLGVVSSVVVHGLFRVLRLAMQRVSFFRVIIFFTVIATATFGKLNTIGQEELEKRFMDWLTSNGASLSRVELAHFPLGRGVRARSNIYYDDLIYEVPLHFNLNVKAALKSPMGPALLQFMNENDLSREKLLPMFVAYEMLKGEDSFWEPYFALLPSQPYDLPLYWRFIRSPCIVPPLSPY